MQIGTLTGLEGEEHEERSLHLWGDGRVGDRRVQTIPYGASADPMATLGAAITQAHAVRFQPVRDGASYRGPLDEPKVAETIASAVEVVAGADLLDRCEEFTRLANP